MSTSRTAPPPGPRGTLPASRSWRRESSFGAVRARWFASRVLLLLAVVGFVGYFVFAVQRPFQHARPLLVLLGEPIAGGAIPERSLLPIPFAGFVRNDFDAFESLAAVTGENDDGPMRLSAPATNDGLGRLRRELAEADGSESVAIVYVAGSGVSVDGQPALYWNRLDDDGVPTRTDLGTLLDVVSSAPARSKLLLLDAGNVRTLPAQGMLVNDFIALLVDEVEQRDDPSLWVLVSHSMLEVSQLGHAERRSIFGSSVVEGLEGGADANDDRAVDVAELYEFTARTVGRRVDEMTLGLESQTPRLLWGGGSLEDAPSPVLVPVSETSQRTNGTATTDGSPTSGTAEGGDTAKAGANGSAGSDAKPSPGDGTNGSNATAAPAKSADASPRASPNTTDSPPATTPPSGTAAKTPDGPTSGTSSTGNSASLSSNSAKGADPNGAPNSRANGNSNGKQSTATQNPAESPEVAKLLKSLDPTRRKLYETWALRDELLERKGPAWRTAADTNPGAWRGLENTLMMYEWRIRREQDAPAAMQAALDRLGDDFRTLDRRSREIEPVDTPGTLGMVQFWTKSDDPLRTILAPFDAAIASPNEAALRKLLAKPPAGTTELAEVHLAQQLLASTAPWDVVRSTLGSRRRFEMAVASTGRFAPWVAADVDWTAAHLASAERTLLDGVDPARDRSAVERLLREAGQRLTSVEEAIVTLQRARQARNDAALRLGNDVDWTFRTTAAVPDEHHGVGRPREIIAGLRRLSALLEAPGPNLVDDVARATAHLEGLRRDVESTASSAYVVALAESGRGVAPGFLEALLANPACSADVRVLAGAALRDVEEDGREGDDIRHMAWTARLRPMLLASRWQPYVRLADDELASRRLERTLAGIRENEIAVAKADRERIVQLRTGVESNVVDDAHRDQVRRIFRQLGREIAEFHRSHPAGLPTWADFRSLEPMPRNDGPRIGNDALAATLRLRNTVLASDLQGSDDAETRTLANEFTSIGFDLARIGNERPTAPSTGIRARAAVDFRTGGLDDSTRAVVTVQIDWRASDPVSAWVAVDVAAGIDVVSESATRVATVASLDSSPADHVAFRSELRSRPPALRLRGDRPTTISFALVSTNGVPPQGRVVVHVVTADESTRLPITLPESNAPPIAIRCSGIDRTYAFDDDESVLHPFPNRATSFRLLAASTNGRAHEVLAELYAPSNGSVPTRRISVTNDEAAAILDRLNASTPIARQPKLAIPAAGSAVPISWAAPATPPSAAPASGTKTTGMPVETPLLLVLREKERGRVEFVPIRVAPQHPRRYTRVEGQYDAATRTARVAVSVPRPSTRPSGTIPVTAEIRRSSLSASRSAKPIVVESEVRAGDTLARLSIPVPQEVDGPATLLVGVDGWPRAFTFAIDPARSDGTLAEVRDELSARIVDPDADHAYPGDVRSIPVGVQADLPELAGANGNGRVLVGLDLNGDRELDGEPRVAVTSDREVAPTASITTDGRLELSVKVTDLVVPVPVPTSTNARTELLVRVDAGAKSAWSPGVPVVVDGEPPRVLAFALTTRPPVVLGAPATALVNVTDDGLSGVAKVEVAFDPTGSGEFPKKGTVFNGVRGPGGGWLVTIPTATVTAGQHDLLVRATDLVGNVSAVRRLTVTAVTKAEREKTLAETTRIVRGQVTYLGDPVPGASVVIRPAVAKPTDDTEPLEVTTKADGTFEFPKVRPGNVQVTAEAVVRDRRRKDAKTVEVPVVPEDPPFVTLELPYARKP